MVSALRPGGWVLIEDFDMGLQPLACPDARGPEHDRANRIRIGFRELLIGRGVDREYGRTLPRLLRAVGLEEVRADAYFPLAHPGGAMLELANVTQVRAGLVAGGYASEAEIDAHLVEVRAGRLDLTTPPLVSARGRRPR